jgi:uncharacterized protein (TIGR02186 family)
MVRGALALLLLLAAPAAQAAELVARLSSERISVTTAFTGENLLVFGSTEEPIGPGGDEILIVARGPTSPFIVRRKVQVLGMWFNGPSARFEEVPGFYAITGSRAAWRLLPEALRQEHALGLDAIPLASTGARGPAFRAALIELKRESGVWQEDKGEVEIAGARLFSARIPLPSTVPAGAYSVEVYLVRSRRIVAVEHLGFEVARTGTAASIEALARGWPALYGLMCVVLAAFAGWLGSVVFRRG